MVAPIEHIELRGNDPTGHGYYGAKRGSRKHKGLDLVAKPGTKVMCPIDGVITKIGQVYENTSRFKYIEITNDVYRHRLLYIKPYTWVKKGIRVFECDVIGEVQNISFYHNSRMKNHLHWEIYKHGLLTDPEPLLELIVNQI